ncbi:MAG: hypothetical protein A3D94_19485 [Alphaproteobacteria bacterium RIFCSPHIGHO2_12_FULL_66_14]|nr:MAG: hypothetical protein A3D94_19485 [Alphaproteobacteria bacterium RIFCSPHIGHO2_12_FULL_66_14]
MRLAQRPFRFDGCMAEDIERHVAAQRAVAERHFVDRARHHRSASLGEGHAGRHGVEIKPQGRPSGHACAQNAQHAAGAAAGVEHRTARR